MGSKPAKSPGDNNGGGESGPAGSSSLSGENDKNAPIPEDYIDPVFGPCSVKIWTIVCSFMTRSDVLNQLSFLNRGFNSALIYRTIKHVNLCTDLKKVQAKEYMNWCLRKFHFCTSLDANGFKYKRIYNFLIFKLPKLEKISCRFNTALLVKILPDRTNITHYESSLKGLVQYAKLIKSTTLKHLTLTEMDESTPVQEILMACPNLQTLEISTGWARNYPTLTHHRLEVVKAGQSESGSHYIDFRSKMANRLDDYLPNVKELYDVSGNSTIKSSTLERLDCYFFRRLDETIEACPSLTTVHAYSSSLNTVRGEFENLRELHMNKVKVNDVAQLFAKLVNVERLSIRNVRLEKYPLENKAEKLKCEKLRKLHLEVEYTYPSEDLSLLIAGFPKLRDFTLRYIPRKKLTYDEVLKVMEVKKVVLKTEFENLGRFSLIEGYHRDYPIYYEVDLKETFKGCKGLKTVVFVTFPTRKKKKMKRVLFSRQKGMKIGTVWVCDRKVFTEKPGKKLKKAEESKSKAEEAQREKEKHEQLTIVQKMNVMEENSEAIEEDSILRKAEAILKKKESEMNEFDEEILAQADEIMNKRKQNMALIHARMKKKRKRAKSQDVKREEKEKVTEQEPEPENFLIKVDSEDNGKSVKERVRTKIKASNNWGMFSNLVKQKSSEGVKSEDKSEEDGGVDLSLFSDPATGGSDGFDSILNTPAMTPMGSRDKIFDLVGEEKPNSSGGLDFQNILGQLRGNVPTDEKGENEKEEEKKTEEVLDDNSPSNDVQQEVKQSEKDGSSPDPEIEETPDGDKDGAKENASVGGMLGKLTKVDSAEANESEDAVASFGNLMSELRASRSQKIEPIISVEEPESSGMFGDLMDRIDQAKEEENLDGSSFTIPSELTQEDPIIPLASENQEVKEFAKGEEVVSIGTFLEENTMEDIMGGDGSSLALLDDSFDPQSKNVLEGEDRTPGKSLEKKGDETQRPSSGSKKEEPVLQVKTMEIGEASEEIKNEEEDSEKIKNDIGIEEQETFGGSLMFDGDDFAFDAFEKDIADIDAGMYDFD